VLAALGRGIARRPGLIVLLWIAFTIAGFAAASGAFGESLFARLNASESTVPSESTDGREILDAASTTGASLSLMVQNADAADPVLADPITSARADLLAIPGMAKVVDPLALPGGPTSPAAAALIAKTGAGFLVSATLQPDLAGDVQDAALDATQARLTLLSGEITAAVPGASGQVGGGTLLFDAVNSQVEKDLVRGELIALPLSLLVMVLVFGGFLAAGMPIAGAIASIAGALATLLGFSYLIDLDSAAVNVVTVLGLGLCIDYGLLIVSRYREE
jgi:RND superfamily putative drug exporter